MTLFYVLYSLAIPGVLWLLFGAPDLKNSANVLFFVVVVLHLYVLIWQRKIFKWLGGDYYTYGSVNFAINLASLLYTLIFSLLLFHRAALFEMVFGKTYYAGLHAVPSALIGLMSAGLLVTISLAVFTSRHLDPLPRKSERRSFEPPGEGGI